MKRIYLLLIIFLGSCEDNNVIDIPAGYECERAEGLARLRCFNQSYLFKVECDKKEQGKFIIDCAKAANPLSDEEGEDLVRQCERTSRNLFCVNKYTIKE